MFGRRLVIEARPSGCDRVIAAGPASAARERLPERKHASVTQGLALSGSPLDGARDLDEAEALRGRGREGEQGQGVAIGLAPPVAHGQVPRHPTLGGEPVERLRLAAERVDEPQLDRLAAGEDPPVGDAGEERLV